MDFATFDVEDRRLTILRALAGEHDGHLNEALLQKHLERYGHHVDKVTVGRLLRELELWGAVKLYEPADDMMVAEITQRGEDHVARRIKIKGVAVPGRPQV